ncbi:Rossmann-fold NAD(P)-binding domain-containing protein [Mycobacterium colombiense]|nr:hypothetical protein [Mycobacterium colombiense]
MKIIRPRDEPDPPHYVMIQDADPVDHPGLPYLMEAATPPTVAVRAPVNIAAVRADGAAFDAMEEAWDVTVAVILTSQLVVNQESLRRMTDLSERPVVTCSPLQTCPPSAEISHVAPIRGRLGLAMVLRHERADHLLRVNAMVAGLILD